MLAGLHLLLLFALMHTLHSESRAPARSIELRMVAEPPAAPVRPVKVPREAAAYAPPMPAAMPPLGIPTIPTVEAAVPATLASPAAPAASAPLKLALPPLLNKTPTARDLAMQDPRSHSQKMSVEDHIADATGTLPIDTQMSTNDTETKITRQGTKCTMVSAPRIGTLNPMDSRATTLPGMVTDCSK